MVGTPKSTGCANCRKRKKKCGQEQPECHACTSAGWKCPGFTKTWKFVDQTHGLRSEYQNKRYLFEGGNPSSSAAVPLLEGGAGNVFSLYEEYSAHPGKFRVQITRSLHSDSDHNAALLIYLLEDEMSQSVFPLNSHGSFYGHIPSHLGKNIALDTSTECLCRIFLDTLSHNTVGLQAALRQYAKSLNALRVCIENPATQLQSETLCASILLQMCELMLNADNGRWSHLSKGTKLLVQHCGPARFKSPFERAMLESQRAFFIIHDMNDGQQCFLSRPEWRQLLQTPSRRPITTLPKSSLALRSQLCDILVDVPELLAAKSVRDRKDSLDPLEMDEPEDNDLLGRTISINCKLENWYNTEVKPLIVGSYFPLPPVQPHGIINPLKPVETYPDIMFAVLDCIANSVLINLQELLSSLIFALPEVHYSASATDFPTATTSRYQIFRNSLLFVQHHSKVAAKPLEFGLRQIWSDKLPLAMLGSPRTPRS